MKGFWIWLLFTASINQLIINDAKAQNNGADIENIYKATLVLPGISYEVRLGNKQTLYTEAYLPFYFGFSYSSTYGNNSDFRVFPALETGYRYYYNGNRRAKNGYVTSRNNMNYFTFVYLPNISNGAISDSYIQESKNRLINTIGIAWGFQRNYRNRLSIDVYIGPGCSMAPSTTSNEMGQHFSKWGVAPTVVIKTRFGWWLNKRKD